MKRKVNVVMAVMTIYALFSMLQTRDSAMKVKETMAVGREAVYMEENYTKTKNTGNKKIAITFDDGPHPQYTEQLLEGLKERGVKATFFVTGEHAELHPDIVARMSEEGG